MYRVFAAMRKFLQFALIDFVLRIPQVFFYWYLCTQPTIGLAGIPLTDLAFYGIMFAICLLIVKSKVGSFGIPGIVSVFIRCGAASLVAGVVVYFIVGAIQTALPTTGTYAILFALGTIIVCGVIGLVIAFGLCKVLRVPEFSVLSSLSKKFLGRLKRS